MKRILSIFLLAGLLSVFSVSVVSAAPAPSVELYQAKVYRNVIDDSGSGDMVLVVRGELPLSGWCSLLIDTDGCSDTPPNPTNPTSLDSGLVWLRMYEGSGADKVGEKSLRRVGNFIQDIYFPVGHGLDWDPSGGTTIACIETDVGSFDVGTEQSVCFSAEFSGAAADRSSQREDMGDGMLSIMRDLEVANNQASGTYVNTTNKITTDGQVYTREFDFAIERVIPSFFQTGASLVFENDAPSSTGTTPLQASLDAEPTVAAQRAQLNVITEEYTGFSWGLLGSIAVIAASGGVAGLTRKLTQRVDRTGATAIFAFFIPMGIGAIWRTPPIEFTVSILFLGTLVLAGYFVNGFFQGRRTT